MRWEKFEKFFHPSWKNKLKPFIESIECDEIYKELKLKSKEGEQIAPLSSNVWKAFLMTPYDELKLVIAGTPYCTKKDGIFINDGLYLGCSDSKYVQPELRKFYTTMEDELCDGLNLCYFDNPDVSYLAEQGVLMLNASLTVKLDEPGSHNDLWEPFMKYLFEHVISGTNTPVLLLGEASRWKKYVKASILITPSKGMYKNIDEFLKKTNDYKIEWLQILF